MVNLRMIISPLIGRRLRRLARRGEGLSAWRAGARCGLARISGNSAAIQFLLKE